MKPTIQTPLNLGVLLHHYYSPKPYSPDTEVGRRANNYLLANGMIREGAAKDVYDLTEKGQFYIRHILDVLPFPETTYYIPEIIRD